MKINRMMLVGGAALCLFGMTTNAFADGKKTFVDLKCTSCHSVKAQGIEGKATDPSDKIVDLSKVGAERNADWIKKYLNKEVDIKGKKHKKAFKGSPAELNDLATWLAGLK